MNNLDHGVLHFIEIYYKHWKPTPEKINDLPKKVRDYIHEIIANSDPSGMVAENIIAKDTIKALNIEFIDALEEIQNEISDSAEHEETINVLDRYIIEYKNRK